MGGVQEMTEIVEEVSKHNSVASREPMTAVHCNCLGQRAIPDSILSRSSTTPTTLSRMKIAR
jgi:hypothetical protein